jgi:hypothetical protein
MTTPEPECLDEGMRGTGDPADYDGWADEAPGAAERLTEIARGLAELAGLTIGPALAAEPATPSVIVKLTCGRCNGAAFLAHLRLDTGVTQELYDTHLCTGVTDGRHVGEPAVFPFTLAVMSGA